MNVPWTVSYTHLDVYKRQLYDLTPGHRAKIALADLDLTATAKQNDDRGIDFQLPVGPETN